jgi:NAD(P)-dependent dehydrogenase (short-subunit alcohol dehydrogenase family)
VAIAFAREGADVVLSYMPPEEPDAQQVVQLIQEAGRTAVAVPGDVKDEAYCQQLVATAVQQLGGLDILVNVAGKQQEVPDIEELTTEQFDETFKTNVYALFWLCKAALPHMPAGSTIINTTSVEAYKPSPILLDYASTKAAINTFSKALAQQVASKGIRVNAVAPGPVWTPLQVSGGQPTKKLAQFGAQTPLGRPAQPAELAPAFVFLASAESSYVTGETLTVTGGMPTP